MPTASDVIARRLYKAGCRYAFGIPGGEVLALMDALDRAGIRVILAKHENCAGFMGEGVHHFDGAPVILVATIGPGIANAANVIANATQDRVPMIALTGCVTAQHQHTYTHQVFDHVAMAAPISKAAFRIESDTAGVVVDKAVAIATGGRPGAVLLDVPVDVQTETDNSTTPSRAPLAPMQPAGDSLETAGRWFAESKAPLLIAGVDALNQNAGDAVAAFCKSYRIPLITTYKAKGVLPEDHPLALGGAGLSPKIDKHLLPLVAQSDLVILAGYDPIEMRTGWQHPWPENAQVIELSAEANTHYMHQAALNFVGDIASSLVAICDGATPVDTWLSNAPESVRREIRDSLAADEEWGPAAVIDECRKNTPRNTVATVDSGAHRILLSQLWECYEPRGLLQSTALCTMGCAVPLAIGRKLAEPERPVIAFVGDAGLEMFLGELATLRDLQLNIPIIVFVDESLGLIELKQRGSGYENLAVDFGATNFPAVATALGGEGVWIRDRVCLGRALNAAFERETFTVIAVVIGEKAYEGRL